VVRLWSVARRHGFHLRTQCPREDPRVPSLVGVFAGAAWHEREAAEMFGLVFDGAPEPRAAAAAGRLPGHPLRKERVLAARQAPVAGRESTRRASRAGVWCRRAAAARASRRAPVSGGWAGRRGTKKRAWPDLPERAGTSL
jgi:hypothetical protein